MRQNLGERRENDEREGLERERGERGRPLGFEKTKVTSSPNLMSLYTSPYFPSSKVTPNSPKTLI